MPWRLIVIIVVFAVFLTFISFNLDNKCDINFGFTKLSEVPVFLTVFISFALGLICTMPFIISARFKRKALTVPDKKLVKKTDNKDSESGNREGNDNNSFSGKKDSK
jgi:uncharacterized membrane protein YciS (DUF1049 family)